MRAPLLIVGRVVLAAGLAGDAVGNNASWCDSPDGCAASGASAQELHLNEGEQPRPGKTCQDGAFGAISCPWGGGMIEQVIEADVFVVGGGSAGSSAAIAAARGGARTVIAEGAPMLGGNSGPQKRVKMVGACGSRADQQGSAGVLECREGGIVEEYLLENAVNNPTVVPEIFSLEILTAMKAEPNLTVLLNTWMVSAETQGGAATKSITSVTCENQMVQRRYKINAKAFVDASGDGRLGAEVGAEWIQGREGQSYFNESLAVPDPGDNETEGSSTEFWAEDTGSPVQFRPPWWSKKYTKSQFRYRPVSGTMPGGTWWNEVSWPFNTVTDGENITEQGIAQVLGIWDYIKNSGEHPDSANMGLTYIQLSPGKREGRRFRGQYVLTQNDVMRDYKAFPHGKQFPPPGAKGAPQSPELFWDRVSYSGWPFDLHNPKGMLDPDHPPFAHYVVPYIFSTPLRSLVSKDLSNLFFAGRLASFSHVVFGSERVQKTCATMGQAVGTAAAYAIMHGVDPLKLQDNPAAIWSIQQQLLRDDQYIIGLYNEDPRDHARLANATASSETARGPAANVLSGQSRAIVTGPLSGHAGGVPPTQGIPGSNRWISEDLPATLTLQLKAPIQLQQAEIVFDTGMHKEIDQEPLPTSTGAHQGLGRRGPQPETVRDYLIEGQDAASGQWITLCNVSENYQRKRIHTLPCPIEPPGPPPAPAPQTVAVGAVQANICRGMNAPEQMWTINTTSGELSTSDGRGGKLCLGFDETMLAFGGDGKAVVARPCGAENSTKWTLKEAPGGPSFAKLIETVTPTACAKSKSLVDPTDTSLHAFTPPTCTVSGAGLKAANGNYTWTEDGHEGAIYSKDGYTADKLYQWKVDQEWKLGKFAKELYYEAKGASSVPPAADQWKVVGKGISPPPQSIVCRGMTPPPPTPPGPPKSCSCVHAVPCASCHATSSGQNGQKYYAGTAVELTDCAATGSTQHLEWQQLFVGSSNATAGMLMSGGLCLEAATHNSTDNTLVAATDVLLPPMLTKPRVNTRAAAATSDPQPSALGPMSHVRVVVTRTNGIAAAHINEIRLYGSDGVAPFPTQPNAST